MRALAPILLLSILTCAGCRSGRDYTSVNRSSLRFLFETVREGRKMRRENLRSALRFGPRLRENLREKRKGRAFAYGSYWLGTWQAAGDAWRGFKRELRPTSGFAASVRFGLLDSGD